MKEMTCYIRVTAGGSVFLDQSIYDDPTKIRPTLNSVPLGHQSRLPGFFSELPKNSQQKITFQIEDVVVDPGQPKNPPVFSAPTKPGKCCGGR